MIAAQLSNRRGVPLFRPALALLQTLMIAHALIYLLNPSVDLGAPLRIFMIISILLGVGMIVLLARLDELRATLSPWRVPLLGGAMAYLFALALVPLPEAVIPHLIHTHMTLTFVVSFAVLSLNLFDLSMPLRLPRTALIAAAAGVVVICVIRIYGLTAYPFIDWQDEAQTMAWTQQLMQTGRLGDPTFVGLGDSYYAYPRFYIGLAAWFQMFGMGLWQGRVFGFLLIFPLIVFSALAARNLFGTRAAWLTAAFMFASAVVMSAARIRHDIGLAICVAVSIWLYTEAVRREQAARKGANALHFLAGVVVAWGMFSHYHAAGFGVALLIGLYAPRYLAQARRRELPLIRRVLPESAIWLFGIGGLLGALSVLVLQMIPDDIQGWLYALQQQSKYSDDGTQFFVAFFGNFISIGFFSIFDLLLIAAGALMALRRRRPADITLLLILLASHLLLAIMASGAIYYYTLPLTPVYAMLVATLLDKSPHPDLSPYEPSLPGRGAKNQADRFLPLSTQAEGEGFSAASVVLFAFLLLPSLGYTLSKPVQHMLNGAPMHLPPLPAAQWVLDNVPTDQVIAGDLRYRLWLYEYPFASHLIPAYLYPENVERLDTPEKIWRAVDMEILIVDPPYPRSFKYFGPLVESGFLARYGYQRVAEFPAPDNTVTTVYMR